MADLVPRDDEDAVRDYLDLAAIFTSAIPVLGGAISNVLGGWSQDRRYQRMREVLERIAKRLGEIGNRIRDEYVRSDEFEDLLDQTLRRVAAERHEAKRRLYAAFLVGAVTSPGEPYHENLRVLRTLEELQPDHLRIIHAMLQEPVIPPGSGGISPKGAGPFIRTLHQRLPDMPMTRLDELVEQLTKELHLTTIEGQELNSMTSAQRAQDLRSRFTPYGYRLIDYIRAAQED